MTGPDQVQEMKLKATNAHLNNGHSAPKVFEEIQEILRGAESAYEDVFWTSKTNWIPYIGCYRCNRSSNPGLYSLCI